MGARILLIRYAAKSDITTYADFHLYMNDKHLFHCKAMELGWKDNAPRVSRIPEGEYKMKLEWSPAFKQNLYELKGVPDRGEIKIHVANYYHQLKGCIALGTGVEDINKDGVDDMKQSTSAFDTFMKLMNKKPEAVIKIVDLFSN